MRHQKTRHKLSRDSAHRRALLRNLSKEIILHGRIRTTSAKAKAVKPEVEKLITLAQEDSVHNRRLAQAKLGHDDFIVKKLVRRHRTALRHPPGRLHRILKLGPRRSDSTEMVFIELV